MTMRTYRYFQCENGHRGEEKTSENDQPYSQMRESVSTKGVRSLGEDSRANVSYSCEVCNMPMFATTKPQP